MFNNRIIKVSSSNFLLVGDSLMGKARTKASQVALVVKNLPAKARDRDLGLIPGWGRSPGEREWLPTLVLLPGESHGYRSLAG